MKCTAWKCPCGVFSHEDSCLNCGEPHATALEVEGTYVAPRRAIQEDALSEDACRICEMRIAEGWDCIALQLAVTKGATRHPGHCWNGRYPDYISVVLEADAA